MKKSVTFHLMLILCLCLFCIKSVSAQSGYERPIVISDEEAYKYAAAYKKAAGGDTNPNVITGGVMTRESFDDILRVTNCNAVTYKLCMDPTGTIAPPTAVFIVVSGANVVDQAGRLTVTEIGCLKYRGNDWCPPNCMRFTITDAKSGQTITVE